MLLLDAAQGMFAVTVIVCAVVLFAAHANSDDGEMAIVAPACVTVTSRDVPPPETIIFTERAVAAVFAVAASENDVFAGVRPVLFESVKPVDVPLNAAAQSTFDETVMVVAPCAVGAHSAGAVIVMFGARAA